VVQGTFLGKQRREVVSDVFRELSIPYNPNLSQRLSAHAKYHLELGEEHIALEKEIASLTRNRDSESRNRLKMLPSTPFPMAEFLPVRDTVRFYLVNETLGPHDKVRQFLHRTKWLEHLQRHIEGLRKSERENKLMSVERPCPRPRRPKSFYCVLELEFHLQDIHGLDMPKQFENTKRDQECRVKRSNKL
jgi:hypothetical protein